MNCIKMKCINVNLSDLRDTFVHNYCLIITRGVQSKNIIFIQ